MSGFDDIEDERTEQSPAGSSDASTDVSVPLPDGANTAFDDVDEATSIDGPPPAGAAPPPLVQPPSSPFVEPHLERLDVSVPDTAEMVNPGPGPDAWSDSTAPLRPGGVPVPVPSAPVEPPPRNTMPMEQGPAPGPTPRHIGPVPEAPAPAAKRGVPPAVIWVALGFFAILVVVLTALVAIWLVS